MNLLVVGVSHHTATMDLLERVAVTLDETPEVLAELCAQPHLREAVVLSTCNRVEIYAAVTAFHGGLAEIGAVLAARTGLPIAGLAAHLYVHYDRDAVAHALRVAAGLESMVVGEAQILGQLREAYGVAAEHDATGRFLHELMQQALRVGKRVHAETGIDRAGRSVVSAALDLVPEGVAGRPALVVGAGSMGALALATLSRAGAGPLLVANRSAERAQRLAALHGAAAVDLGALPTILSTVDIVVSATASPGLVLTEPVVRDALARRAAESDGLTGADRPAGRSADRRDDRSGRVGLAVLDLAVPRDVAAEVGDLPGVVLVDMTRVGAASSRELPEPAAGDWHAAEQIVATEVEAFLSWFRGTDVAPTVAALRARADEVVELELARLVQRRPDLTAEQRADVAHTVHRVVQRLLHSPTVRVRQLATSPGGDQYAALLRELFDLAVPAVEDNVRRAVDVRPDASSLDAPDVPLARQASDDDRAQ